MNNHWLCVLCGEGGGFKSSRDLIFTPAHAFIFTSSASHIFNLATHKQLLLCFFNINYMQSCNNIVALPLLISVSQRPEFPFVCCGFVFFFSGHKTLAFFSCSSFFPCLPLFSCFLHASIVFACASVFVGIFSSHPPLLLTLPFATFPSFSSCFNPFGFCEEDGTILVKNELKHVSALIEERKLCTSFDYRVVMAN